MNIIKERSDVAKELHSIFIKFMKETNVEEGLVKPRLKMDL